jgi:hypothetical protein
VTTYTPYDAAEQYKSLPSLISSLLTTVREAFTEEETAPGMYAERTAAPLQEIEDLTGVALPRSADRAVEIEKLLRPVEKALSEIRDCPPPRLPGYTVRPASDLGPAHFAGPSGLPTLAIFTIWLASEEVGKRPLLDRKGVVKKSEHARNLAGKGGAPFAAWHTVLSVGAGNLEDVIHWAKLAGEVKGRNGYITRVMLPEHLAPAARGLRRAVQDSLENHPSGKLAVSGAGALGTLLLVDFDNCGEVDDLADLETLTAKANELLPPEFEDAKYCLTLSASHSVKGEARLRVLALGSVPVPLQEYKAWIEDGDQVMATVSQPCFVSRHCLSQIDHTDVADPFAHLLWQVVNEDGEEVVEVPVMQSVGKPLKASAELLARDMDYGEGAALSPADFTTRERLELTKLRRRVVAADDLARGALFDDPALAVRIVNAWRAQIALAAEEDTDTAPGRRRKGSAVRVDYSAPAMSKLTLSEITAKIGDGRGGVGFFNPLFPLAKRLWIERGDFSPEGIEPITTEVCRLYRAADASKHGPRYVEEAYTPARVRRDVAAARHPAELQAKKEAAERAAYEGDVIDDEDDEDWEALQGAPKPLPTKSLDEARGVVTTGLERFHTVTTKLREYWQQHGLGELGEEYRDEKGKMKFGHGFTSLVEDGDTEAFAEAHQAFHSLGWSAASFANFEPAERAIRMLEELGGMTEEEFGALVRDLLFYTGAMGRQVLSMRVTPGVGKTHSVIDLINRDTRERRGNDVRFGYAAPDAGLAKQTVDAIEGGGLARGIDVYCGKQLDAKGRERTELLTRRHIALGLGFSTEAYCQTMCREYAGCGYWGQAQTLKDSRVYGFPHGIKAIGSSLAKPLQAAGWEPPPVMVLDEARPEHLIERPGINLFAGLDFATRWNKAAHFLGEFGGEETASFWTALKLDERPAEPGMEPSKNALHRSKFFAFMQKLNTMGQDFPRHGKAVRLTVKEVREIVRMVPKVAGREASLTALDLPIGVIQKNRAKFAALLGAAERRSPDAENVASVHNDRKALIEFLSALRRIEPQLKDPGLDEETLVPGWVFQYAAPDPEKHKPASGGLNYPRLKPFHKDWDMTTLLHLDATARPNLQRLMFPDGFVDLNAEAREEAVVRHMRFATNGKRNVSTADRGAYVDLWARRMARLGSVGVVTDMAVEEAIERAEREVAATVTRAENFRRALEEPERAPGARAIAESFLAEHGSTRFVPSPYVIMHHGAARGRNDMAAVRTFALFGRPLPDPDTLQEHASVLGGKILPEVKVTRVPAYWQMRDGALIRGKRFGVVGDVVVDDLVRVGCEDELIQADGRTRAVQRTAANPVTCFWHVDAVCEGVAFDTEPEGRGADRQALPLGEASMVADFVRVAYGEMGLLPVGNMGARVWRELLAVETVDGSRAEVSAGAWQHLRADATIGGVALGELLDHAEGWWKAQARGDKAVTVARVEIEGKGCVVFCVTAEALGVLEAAGLKPEVLTGEPRRGGVKAR